MRRPRSAHVALILGLMLVSACGQTTGQQVLNSVVGGPLGTDPDEMRQLEREGAPRVVVRLLDRGQASTLHLAGERDGAMRWRSLDNVQIYTRDGLIIGSRGLSFDLMTADTGRAAQIIALGGSGQVTRINRLLDGEGRIAIRTYACDIAPVATETIRIGETETATALRLDETCRSPRGDLINRHWVVGNRILQTEQVFSPDLGRLLLVFLPN